MDRFNSHTVGGLKWIQVDLVSGIGSKCVFSITLCKQIMAVNCAGWSNEETKALLGIWGARKVQSQLDGIVHNRTIYVKKLLLSYVMPAMKEHGSSARRKYKIWSRGTKRYRN